MILSDSLSRRPDLCPEDDMDNENITMLPDKLFVNFMDTELLRKIATTADLDKEVTDALQILLQKGPTALKNDLADWDIKFMDEKPIFFWKDKQYILRNMELHWEVVRRFHDLPSGGHPGELETFNLIRQHYWWPGQPQFVKNFVKGCAHCQQFKINQHLTKPALMPIEGSTSLLPFAQCSMDFITDLPVSKGFDAIMMVVVDHGLTKGVILIPCCKTITAEETAKLLLENLYK